jgi:hypothetical protein
MLEIQCGGVATGEIICLLAGSTVFLEVQILRLADPVVLFQSAPGFL